MKERYNFWIIAVLMGAIWCQPAISMDFVNVGDLGNTQDTRLVRGSYYYGDVDYTYMIGRYEVTNAQYCEFLNAVARSDPYSLYNANMVDSSYYNRGGITRSGSSGSYTYTCISGRENKPVNWVSWRSAARFCNWMHNGRPNDANSTESGAYSSPGSGPITHNVNARYWIPKVDEWYKAAFYKAGGINAGYWTYATKSNSSPGGGPTDSIANRANYNSDNYDFGEGVNRGNLVDVGFYTLSPSAYGTFDQSGNLYEWNEEKSVEDTSKRWIFGGHFKLNSAVDVSYDSQSYADPNAGRYDVGFRVAGAYIKEMTFVNVDDTDNAQDDRIVRGCYHYGSVGYPYQIGMYEVTNAQYCQFLNSVAGSDLYGLYNVNMGDANYYNRGGIRRIGTSGNYVYSAIPDRHDKPVNWISWRSAARFANWMHNCMQTDAATTEYGVYDTSTFIGSQDQSFHSSGAMFWIPTVDEWYKAAFYKGGSSNAGYWTYATQSDTAPVPGPNNVTSNKADYQSDNYDFGEGLNHGDLVDVGFYTRSPGTYGTFDQSGNLYEWNQNKCQESTTNRWRFGGQFKSNSASEVSYDSLSHADSAAGRYDTGLRLAAKKKVIHFGYDNPDTSFFTDGNNIAMMKAQPFDGTVFFAKPNGGTDRQFSQNAWGTTKFTQAQMQHAINELRCVKFGSFKENFLYVDVSACAVDWFDSFDTIISNMGMAAWIVNRGGAKGICFDSEMYNRRIWEYNSQTLKGSKSFAEYQEQVRKCAVKIMRAIRAQSPRITIFLLSDYSYIWNTINGNTAQLQNAEYGLYPSFLDGLLDEAGPDVKFIGGTEQSYFFKTFSDFTSVYSNMATNCLPIVADDTTYLNKFSLGCFGLFMDNTVNSYTPAEYENALQYALSVSDEYIWVYTEDTFWWNAWNNKDVDYAWHRAVRNAQRPDSSMEFVTVGDPCNLADNRLVRSAYYYGDVDYTYMIGRYEVTNAQYCEFLNAVARSDPYSLYNANMVDSSYYNRGGITRSGSSGSYTYTCISGRENKPVNWVSWRSAARFCNWMHNGRPNDANSTESGAYSSPGSGPITHNVNARYWIPKVDEWYKAAFYKAGGINAGYWTYATKSNSSPGGGPTDSIANRANYNSDNYDFGEGVNRGNLVDVGFYTLSPSAYGTFDQSGNLYEWNEEKSVEDTSKRWIFGGHFKLNSASEVSYDSQSYSDPDTGRYDVGFRVAATNGVFASTTAFSDDFETNFNKWTDGGSTDWERASSYKHSGSYSAHAGSTQNNLISDNINTSGYYCMKIIFWYMDSGIDDDDDVYLQLYDGTNYDSKLELGNTSPENAWHKYETTIYNYGSDAQYFHQNFRIKFDGASIDSSENIWVYDVSIILQY
jgi:sulfatase modifying factor 1